MMDMPPLALPPREVCIQQAAAYYGTYPDLIRAVIRTEGGKTGTISKNNNNTFDMGLMQINSIHLPYFSKYGITKEKLIGDECLNIFIGTYLLQKNILESGKFWQGIGNYHSKTPDKNIKYQQRVWRAVLALQGGRE